MQAQRRYRVINGDEAVADTVTTPATPAPKKNNIGLALLPITPVPFTGNGAVYAWGRLLAYSALSVLLYNKHKTASYVFAGAAGLSLVTSLAAKAWVDTVADMTASVVSAPLKIAEEL